MNGQLAYRRDEAARVIGVSTDTIDRLISRGELRSARVGGARIIPATELEAFLERKLVEA
ncbi:MAG: helix-turn-helix domain-containing protein [Chloroflexi bacterium]|nr:helix-turn-helix domain-containing protein [Chloroflexota bacterium]